jgi:hypothetical protein
MLRTMHIQARTIPILFTSSRSSLQFQSLQSPAQGIEMPSRFPGFHRPISSSKSKGPRPPTAEIGRAAHMQLIGARTTPQLMLSANRALSFAVSIWVAV